MAALCFHCGEACDKERIVHLEKNYCCNGCLQARLLIDNSILCAPDDENFAPQINNKRNWEELNIPSIANRFIIYEDAEVKHVRFTLSNIHCASCVFVLEHLHKIEPAILKTEVFFAEKSIRMVLRKDIPLSKVAKQLALVGYAPDIETVESTSNETEKIRKFRLRALVIAGFCFANIMLFSIPEYMDLEMKNDPSFVYFFRTINVLLSLPVFFYSSLEFYRGALSGIRNKFMHIDFPLVISLIVAYSRSIYEVLSNTGSGYFDSYSGIVFFMLIGRHFQDLRTDKLGFAKSFKSYFPIVISTKKGNQFQNIPLAEVQENDEIEIHNHEVIPADGTLLSAEAELDYAFVTGESDHKEVLAGKYVYAGARNCSGNIRIRVEKVMEDSHLGLLWNKEARKEENTERQSFTHVVAKWFTLFLMLMSFGAFFILYPTNADKAFRALTTALIVACPCALLLSHTFTTGTALRLLAQGKLLFKNSFVLDKLATLQAFYFDKTGTVTNTHEVRVTYTGEALQPEEKNAFGELLAASLHPISQSLLVSFPRQDGCVLTEFAETPGMGTSGKVNGIFFELKKSTDAHGTAIWINGKWRGVFNLEFEIRVGMQEMLKQLKSGYKLGLLSGDTNADDLRMRKLFPFGSELVYKLSPIEKANGIAKMEESVRCAYVGDGLNDTGALQEASVGISVSDAHQRFTPAADILIPGEQLKNLPAIVAYAKACRRIVFMSFGLSLLYNVIGLSYALTGNLSPLVAAVLMPVSTFTIILFTTSATRRAYKRTLLDKNHKRV
jgi:Cu+-exporting ATPase